MNMTAELVSLAAVRAERDEKTVQTLREVVEGMRKNLRELTTHRKKREAIKRGPAWGGEPIAKQRALDEELSNIIEFISDIEGLLGRAERLLAEMEEDQAAEKA
jgi:hypothetical protein